MKSGSEITIALVIIFGTGKILMNIEFYIELKLN